MKKKFVTILTSIGLIGAMCTQAVGCAANENNYIINVSYDPTREFYEQYNELFVTHWEDVSGETIDVIQSHGGSGKQALEVTVVNLSPKALIYLGFPGSLYVKKLNFSAKTLDIYLKKCGRFAAY